MLQCLEGLKSLLSSVLCCCDIDINNQSRGLEDPELLARETVCTPLMLLYSIDSLLDTICKTRLQKNFNMPTSVKCLMIEI